MGTGTLAKQQDTLRKDVGIMYEKLRHQKNKKEAIRSISDAFYDIVSDMAKHDK
jgi:hypothetical protein